MRSSEPSVTSMIPWTDKLHKQRGMQEDRRGEMAKKKRDNKGRRMLFATQSEGRGRERKRRRSGKKKREEDALCNEKRETREEERTWSGHGREFQIAFLILSRSFLPLLSLFLLICVSDERSLGDLQNQVKRLLAVIAQGKDQVRTQEQVLERYDQQKRALEDDIVQHREDEQTLRKV